MPYTERPTHPPWTAMDAWLEDAKRVGIAYAMRAETERAEAEAEAIAEKAAWRAEHPLGRRRTRQPGSRPWQSAGYTTRALWLADGSPGALPINEE